MGSYRYIASIQGVQRTKLEEEAKSLLDIPPPASEPEVAGDDAKVVEAKAQADAAAALQRIRRKRAKKIVVAFK